MATKQETAKIIAIQSEIVARKDCVNNFGKYKYRTAEGILAEVKPVVNKYGYYIKLNDEFKMLGNFLFIESTAELLNENCEVVLSSKASALHAPEKKGMDLAQISGATSSYARKYALCGLFGIDDSEQDIDANATHDDNPRPLQKMHQSQRQAQQFVAITNEQLNDLKSLITKTNTDEARFLAAYNCDCLENFNAINYADAIGKLNAKDTKAQLQRG